jgi:hypothetical protein
METIPSSQEVAREGSIAPDSAGEADVIEESAVKADLPRTLRNKVLTVGKPLNSSRDIDHFERIEEIRNRSRKIKTVLTAWETQQKEERLLRRTYANYLLFVLYFQIILINAAFFAIGLRYIVVEKWLATTFILAVFFEIAALVLVIVKYLFPKVGSEVLNLIEKM